MERSPLRPAASSPDRAGSAPGGEVGDPVAAISSKVAGSGALSLAIGKPDVLSQAREEGEVTAVAGAAAAAPVEAQRLEGVMVAQLPGVREEEVQKVTEKGEDAVVEAASRLQISDAQTRFVPIKDVKGMLQSGRFEGLEISYWVKKDKLSLLDGIIHGSSYFCCCDDCDHKGKAMTAKAFEQHAYKGKGNETHNPNAHINFRSSNLSVYEACRRLKEAKNEAMENAIFGSIIKPVAFDVGKSKTKTTSSKRSGDKETEITEDRKWQDIMNRLETIEERMEQLERMQLQMDKLEKCVDCLGNEMLKYHSLFEEFSKTLGKFLNM